ncbi:MAG: hypothetical protein COV71_00160 [Candidatus Omnitrophica bacterium CG11_big_fil_rev_8_21_14_0_20_41_12]|nr:MAG: hypothetical protein COV71_00160 [Candidatus Omnitrophica bacterium CG11_big_fil_rev_8_21_14_0_20_41_12]
MFNQKARSFVTVMIFIALLVLLLRLAVDKLIIYNIQQNQLAAQMNLKLLSAALENYAKENNSQYPENIDSLTKHQPVYLERDYLAVGSVGGYEFDCQRMDVSGYNCSAAPLDCKFSGKMIYSVSTGGLIIAEACDKK